MGLCVLGYLEVFHFGYDPRIFSILTLDDIPSIALLTAVSSLCPSQSMRNIYCPRDSLVGRDSTLFRFIPRSANSPKVL